MKSQQCIQDWSIPATVEDKLTSEETKEDRESWRTHFLLNKSHTYRDPFLVTSNNFQLSSQSINVAADPIIIVGIARLPHLVYTFQKKKKKRVNML